MLGCSPYLSPWPVSTLHRRSRLSTAIAMIDDPPGVFVQAPPHGILVPYGHPYDSTIQAGSAQQQVMGAESTAVNERRRPQRMSIMHAGPREPIYPGILHHQPATS